MSGRLIDKTGVRIALVLAALAGVAAVSVHNLDGVLRTQVYEIRAAVPSPSGLTPAVADGGTNGVVTVATLGTVDASIVVTSAKLFPPPYPARLDIHLTDNGDANSALTCTSVAVVGYDQFGNMVKETVSSITESEKLTKYAYEKLVSVTPTGCVKDGDVEDNLSIGVSDHVAVGRKLYADTDLVSICRRTSSSEWQCRNGEDCETGGATSPVGPYAHSVDLGSCGLTVAAGDIVRILMRSPVTSP